MVQEDPDHIKPAPGAGLQDKRLWKAEKLSQTRTTSDQVRRNRESRTQIVLLGADLDAVAA